MSAEKRPWTEGPWELCYHLESEANDKACGCGFRGNITAEGEFAICEMGSTVVKGEEGLELRRFPRPVELANARLMAAAPALYEALERCLVELEFHAGAHSLAEIEMARAALSAALPK
jgi:hypothetical protein